MSSPRRTRLAAVLVLVAAVAATASPASAADPLLPTVRCTLNEALAGSKHPTWPARQRAHVPAALAPTLAVYVGGYQRVVAPRGWRCSAVAAVNGGTSIEASPRGSTSRGVRSFGEPACVGCIYTEVCTYFPAAASQYSVGLECPRLPSFRHVTRLSKTTVRYADDDGEVGLVVFLSGEPSAAGVSCKATPRATCEAVLADWRAHRDD